MSVRKKKLHSTQRNIVGLSINGTSICQIVNHFQKVNEKTSNEIKQPTLLYTVGQTSYSGIPLHYVTQMSQCVGEVDILFLSIDKLSLIYHQVIQSLCHWACSLLNENVRRDGSRKQPSATSNQCVLLRNSITFHKFTPCKSLHFQKY